MRSILPAEVAGTSRQEEVLAVNKLRREALKGKINKGGRLRISMRVSQWLQVKSSSSTTQNKQLTKHTLNNNIEVAEEVAGVVTKVASIIEAKAI